MKRVGFYPCCANDIREPSIALTGLVDEIVYCDKKWSLRDDPVLGNSGPSRTFWRMDLRDALQKISQIDVFFYRRDGTSEGGSGVFVLGREVFPMVLSKMVADHCIIVTDGSNSRGGTFRKMQRNSGLISCGKHITKRSEQRFQGMGVLEFDVKPATTYEVTSHR